MALLNSTRRRSRFCVRMSEVVRVALSDFDICFR